MASIATISPEDRIAIVGKTGSGKTQQAIVLAYYFARNLHAPWEVWWIDTKGVREDINKLRKWGFVNGDSEKDQKRPYALRNAKYFLVRPIAPYTVVDLAQAKIDEAYQRGHVIVVVDEYTQVVVSQRSPGYALDDVFSRGRGKKVGLIGLTQEPVNVPRKLLSQASHLCLFTVTYPYDIKYLKGMCSQYIPPQDRGDKHGFYWSHIDGSAKWAYYTNQAAWAKGLNFQLPRMPKEGDDK